eukprot:1845435-Lingulodinium_polyedra.AAC.1
MRLTECQMQWYVWTETWDTCTDNADTGITQSNFSSVSKRNINIWAGRAAAQCFEPPNEVFGQ